MHLADVASRISQFKARQIEPESGRRAAVAIVLGDGSEGPQFLVIKRAERIGDPWSGQMALPGGRRQPEDADLIATATRETREEIGLDLRTFGSSVGALDDLQAIDRGRQVDLVITPCVFVLTLPPPVLVVDPREVQEVLWLPLRHLGKPEAKAVFVYEIGGTASEHPAFHFQERIIWGLTHRIISQLLTVCSASAAR